MTRAQISAALEASRKKMASLKKDKPADWINDLAAEGLTHATLSRDLAAAERGLAAANSSGEPIDSEAAERIALSRQVNVGEIFAAAVGRREPTGATREAQQSLGLEANMVPIESLRSFRPVNVTEAPATVGVSQQPILGQVFPQSIAAFLGVSMPIVPVGEALFPVITTGADVGAPMEAAAQAETDGVFSADSLAPKRLQAAFRFSVEDLGRFENMSESLRLNLSAHCRTRLTIR